MRGHVHKRVRRDRNGKETTRWYVVVDAGAGAGGRRRQKWHGGYATRREAEVARAKIVNDLHTGCYVSPDRIMLGEWVRQSWLPMIESRIKPSTFDSYRRNMEIHVLPALGTRPLQQLTAAMLNALYAELGRGNGRRPLSPKTVSYIHTIIHKALADALDSDVVASNVAERAKPPRPNRRAAREIQCWEPGELASFLDHVCGTRLEAAWRLAAMTGMRRGEILGLRWGDVDLEAARISVRHAVVSVAYAVLESTPKTHQARVIDLDPETIDVLGEHRRKQKVEREQWGSDYRDNDLVVARENGEPIHPHSFSQGFERLVRRARLRRIRLHDLRHTHATIAVKAGVPVKVISERLGHESPAFTLRQYAHVLPGMQAEAAAEIAKVVQQGVTKGRDPLSDVRAGWQHRLAMKVPASHAVLDPDPFAGVNWDFPGSTVRTATHALHPWPARFIPDLPAAAIEHLTEPGDLVVDPFCGCGTTALEAMLAGRRFDVADINELAALITQAKCWTPREGERAIISSWASQLRPQRSGRGLLAMAPNIPNRSYWFSDEVTCQLAYLLDEIKSLECSTDFLRVVFSAIVTGVSNQESETRYRRVSRDVSASQVIERFRSQLARALGMAVELDTAPRPQGFVACRDSRATQPDAPRADLAVFSPPYPNAFDYHLYHRFRMFWLGFDPVQTKHSEIGAHLRYQPDEQGWLADVTASFQALHGRLRPGGHAVCVVGDGIIRGERIPSGDLLWARMSERGFQQIRRFVRRIPVGRKSFKASDGRLKSEHVLVFRRADG